jgi:hypothetical protein
MLAASELPSAKTPSRDSIIGVVVVVLAILSLLSLN